MGSNPVVGEDNSLTSLQTKSYVPIQERPVYEHITEKVDRVIE